MLVDYESPLAGKVVGRIRPGLSGGMIGLEYSKPTGLWESLWVPRSKGRLKRPRIYIFVIDHERLDNVNVVRSVGDPGAFLCNVVAVTVRPNRLAGSLLYRGVERLDERTIRVRAVDSTLRHAFPSACEYHARRLLERLQVA